MKISKQRLACLLFNAISLLEDEVVDRGEMRKQIGITDEELLAIENGNVEEGLTSEERYKIAREVDAEDKLRDIETRVREMYECDSPFLHSFTAEEVIENKKLMNNILKRYERAEAWMDNGSYWELLDDCIREEAGKEMARVVIDAIV